MLAHIHIMKTAGQTVCNILRTSFGANHCDLRCGDLATRNDIEFARRFYPNLQSIGGHSIRPRGDLLDVPSIRFFTFLRDPIARCLSHYQFEVNRNKRNVDFLQWLEQNADYQTRILSRTREPQIAIEVLEQRVAFVGLVEDFDRSLSLLRAWGGLCSVAHYKSRNIASDNSVTEQILASPELVRAIQESHHADRMVYDHVVNVIYPRMIERYTDVSVIEKQSASQVWPAVKRALLYKPFAKTRQRLRAA